jgi:hypothetical protein
MTRLGLAQFEMETFVSQRDMQNFLGQRLRDAADVCGYSYRGHTSPWSPDRLPEDQLFTATRMSCRALTWSACKSIPEGGARTGTVVTAGIATA